MPIPSRFRKQVPGADLQYQPDDLAEYADDPWDIRISLGQAPLDEAYYITVDDPATVRRPVRELIESIALNPDLRQTLDVGEYPELPFLQQELIQLYKAHQEKRLKLEIHINRGPGPIDIEQPAADFLSVCCYHDDSYDYRLLDLVFASDPQPLPDDELAAYRQTWQRFFALLYIAEDAVDHSPFLSDLLGEMAEPQDGKLRLSEHGKTIAHELEDEIARLHDKYDTFRSVAVWPLGLGVPNGFDLRLQFVEYDGGDPLRSAMLFVLDSERHELFDPEHWLQDLQDCVGFDYVIQSLATRTQFSAEDLNAVREFAKEQ